MLTPAVSFGVSLYPKLELQLNGIRHCFLKDKKYRTVVKKGMGSKNSATYPNCKVQKGIPARKSAVYPK